jgi:hypothetical protein
MFEDLIPWLALSRENIEDLMLGFLLFTFVSLFIAVGGLD